MNINKLKEILENAPEGATHIEAFQSLKPSYLKQINERGVYGYKLLSIDRDCLIDSVNISGNIRSLEDIRTIIELYEHCRYLLNWADDHPGMPPTQDAHKVLESFHE